MLAKFFKYVILIILKSRCFCLRKGGIILNKKYSVASLFAGIGGICLGFKKAGMKMVWANEIDDAACITYRYNFGSNYLEQGDINKIDPNSIKEKIGELDILTAGFPCQAFSIAGYQKGFEDDRGNLFFRVRDFAKILEPRVLFLENVKNLYTHDKGRTYERIKNELIELGYKFICPQILNTMNYGNIPQNRERVYIVAFRNENDFENFEELEELPLNREIKDIINTHEKKDEKFYYSKSIYYDRIKDQIKQGNTIYQWRRVYLRENKSNVCPTLTANMGTGGHNVPLLRDDYDVRKLTPEECLLFQGFPEDFTFPKDIPMSACYKQAGNSVSVPVVERLAFKIKEALNKTDKTSHENSN